jgi:ABC-2 type transport system ATP-binding protein
MTATIRSFALTKRYGQRMGVADLDLEVGAGEVFGYLGPNGAGKTTTIRLLLDLIRPTSGRVELFGLDSRRDSIAIRRRVGYLPGELALYERLTGYELLAHFAHLRGGVDHRRIEELAERLDLDLSPPIKALSKGNKQKVGVVQAFMHQPDLLILDEPTAGLDPLAQTVVHELIKESRAAGRSVFLSSHVLSEVERVADRVGIIRDGRLVATEHVSVLKDKSLHFLEARLASPPPSDAFAHVEGVRTVEVTGNVVRISLSPPMDAVIKALAGFTVEDLTVREPDLEEIFLTYYGPQPPTVAERSQEVAHAG